MSDVVLVHRRDEVMFITINRPEVRNALNDSVVNAIGEALDEAQVDASIRAVVLTGTGDRAFCAGADLKPGANFTQYDYSDPHTTFSELLRKAVRFEKPLVARVGGHVLAGGTALLCMCDMAIAADDIRIGLPEVKTGGFPLQVASLMQNIAHRRKFVELCLTGEPFTAREGLEMGLFNYVVPRAELDDKLSWLLSRLLDKSPTAIRRGKNALRAIADMTFEQSISFMEGQIGALVLTEDSKEGRAAFNEKRKPVWSGR